MLYLPFVRVQSRDMVVAWRDGDGHSNCPRVAGLGEGLVAMWDKSLLVSSSSSVVSPWYLVGLSKVECVK